MSQYALKPQKNTSRSVSQMRWITSIALTLGTLTSLLAPVKAHAINPYPVYSREMPRDTATRFNVVIKDGPFQEALAYQIPVILEDEAERKETGRTSQYELLLGRGRTVKLELNTDRRTLLRAMAMLHNEHVTTLVLERTAGSSSDVIHESKISFITSHGSTLNMADVLTAFGDYERSASGISYRSYPSTARLLGMPMCRELFARSVSRLNSPNYRPAF